MTKSFQLLMSAYLCVVIIIKVKSETISTTEDLTNEYYTNEPIMPGQSVPQDEKDAQDIVDSGKNETVIASILPYRDKLRRLSINQRILTKVQGQITIMHPKNHREIIDFWITDTYHPQRIDNSTMTFMDLCFGLMANENVVLGQYLANFFKRQDETWINIAMVLTKDMQGMITSYNKNHEGDLLSFKDLRKEQRHPFENMLRVWVRQNREPIEKDQLNHDCIVKDANTLKAEQNDGGWHENRDQIELILMKKSIKYARAVLQEFEKTSGGKAIEDIIIENINAHKLNHDLADTYASLARYIKNKYAYIANILRQYSDGLDQWAAWIMCIAVVHPQEWPNVDEEFKKDHKDDSLSKFILQKLSNDKVMAEMIASVVDSKFKPTTFYQKSTQANSTPGSPVSTPPPVPATKIAPSSAPSI